MMSTTNVNDIDDLMQSIEKLQKLRDEHFFASGVIITIKDLSGNIICNNVVSGDHFDKVKYEIVSAFKKTLYDKAQFVEAMWRRCQTYLKKDMKKECTDIPELCTTLKPLVGYIGVRVYESKDRFVRNALKRRIKIVAVVNDDLEPYINNRYVCGTCGTVGQCNPVTGYCFICDTDNWKHIDGEFGT